MRLTDGQTAKGAAMTTYTALTTLPGEDAATRLGDALEALTPAPTGVGVFEVEDGSGNRLGCPCPS